MNAHVSGPVVGLAAVLDVLLVVGFAAMGRAEHGGTIELAALAQAAWPFLAALAIVWLGFRVWRRPLSVLRSGLPLWLGTVAIGMVLRVVFTDGGAALPFVLVATGVLAATLVGWRLIAQLVLRLRRSSR